MRAILALPFALFPQFMIADTFPTHAPVTEVTVYGRGALVTREVIVDLPQGQHEVALIFPGEMFRDQTAMQVTVQGADHLGNSWAENLSEPYETFLSPVQKAQLDAIEAGELQLADLRRQNQRLIDEKSALHAQVQFLGAIKPSTERPQSAEEIMKIAQFLPQQLAQTAAAIEQKSAELAQIVEKIETTKETQVERRRQLALTTIDPTNAVAFHLHLHVPSAGPVAIELSNIAGSAGWQITYDLFLSDADQTITAQPSAIVGQQTGEPWIDTRLTLSSADPAQRIQPAHLPKDVVRTRPTQPAPKLLGSADRSYADEAARMSEPMMEPGVIVPSVEEAPGSGVISSYFNGVALRQELPQTVTIYSRGDGAETFELPELVQPIETRFRAHPRRNETAFVIVELTNKTGQPIIGGSANYYRNGTFLGQSYLPSAAIGAEAELAFGPEQSLPLAVRFLDRLSGDTGFITRSNTHREQIEFEVQNLAANAQTVDLRYALPISEKDDIDIDISLTQQPDRRDIDGVKGLSGWDITLAPGETRIIRMDVEVNFPEGQALNWRP